ncbi:MAG: molybdopterin-synthase adenylyltransferase MoeB [Candidatus Latescibacterota bacterium]|nr:molybdopterin-synthase adenylyltransferase MoeB [Candidatus Latescibacterota bacterium]
MSITSNELLSKVKETISEVSVEAVNKELGSGEAVHIIDVRERDEIIDGYIPSAHIIPRGFLEMNIEEDVTMDRAAPIVLYCAGGNRSALAARDLGFLGYTKVRSMVGGFKAWKDSGYEFEQGGLLSEEDLQRYARHIILPEVGEKGQQRLLKGRALLVGAGGLGCPTALYLAAAGVGSIGLVDADVVDMSNLQRQVLFGHSDIGRPKVEAARDRLLELNPGINIKAHHELLTSENVFDIFQQYDVIVNGCDNFPTRYLVNDAAVMVGLPVVDGSIFRFEGQATVYMPGKGPCYRCLYPEPPPPGEVPSCAEGGVLGVLPGTVGLMQATEVVKLILEEGRPLIGRVLLYDAMEMKFRELKLRRDISCPVCGDHPTITKLIDYQQFCGMPVQNEETG